MRKFRVSWVFLAVVAAAAGLRLAGITWGLPHTFNADEPHIVNLAVSFGGGSLRPYSFKYPTLWPYLLFFCYGLYFVVWSGFGLRRGVMDFIGLYAWEPTDFYLIARLLSASLTLLGALVIWKAERERDNAARPWAALLLAFSPLLVELAHSAKPDGLMFFFSCAAWLFGMRVFRDGGRWAHWACGAALGLAMSSQYTALPILFLLPLAHVLGKKSPRRWLLEGLGLTAAGFLAGSPYALLDFSNFKFWLGMRSPAEMAVFGDFDRAAMAGRVLSNLWNFAGAGSLAGLAAVAGLVRLGMTRGKLALVIAGPIALYVPILANNPDGGWQRYLVAAFPGVALLASSGLSWMERPRRPLLNGLLLAAALGPGFIAAALMDREMRLPDTRQAAEAWIRRHIPEGSTILLDQAHASPRLVMKKQQAWELADKTRELGSPRARLYRGMAETHPGGGYRLYRIERSAKDLGTYHPRQVKLSQAESAVLDVGAGLGLSALREAYVDYVVTSSYGAEGGKELKSFYDELYLRGELLKSFEPSPGRMAGPVLRVYRVKLL